MAVACFLAGSAAHGATRFEFSEIFPTGSVGSMTITGSFSGELVDGRITNLSDIEIYRDGVAFRGNGSLFAFQYDQRTRRWVNGGYLSLDGSANNVMFVDTDYVGGNSSFFNYFYSVTGLGNAAFQPSYYRYRVPQTTQMTIRAQPVAPAAGVPEPSAWALFVLGFGALGSAMRRRGLRQVGTAA